MKSHSIAAQVVLTDLMAEIVARGVAPADAVAQAHECTITIGGTFSISGKDLTGAPVGKSARQKSPWVHLSGLATGS